MGFVRHCAVWDVSNTYEVFSVAQLLGDLVSYRASGKGHLELLARLALLRRESLMPKVQEEIVEAPTELIQGAIDFHPFDEAAYTRVLYLMLEEILYCFFVHGCIGKGSCALGLEKGFLYSKVTIGGEVMQEGRICQIKFATVAFQTRCEAAYFVVLSGTYEVFSVAQLLGDLVSYRASGKGHLELLA
ncbi:hypothetical protein Tco_1414854, partial [Tanacetum coccineum]